MLSEQERVGGWGTADGAVREGERLDVTPTTCKAYSNETYDIRLRESVGGVRRVCGSMNE